MSFVSSQLVDFILSDVSRLITSLTNVVSSYRLLVGAAEEIHRTPGVPPGSFDRAVNRFENAGVLVDILLELLCLKLTFSSNLLSVTPAPVDIFPLAASAADSCADPCLVLEQLLYLELTRLLVDKLGGSCTDQCLPPLPPADACQPQPQNGSSLPDEYDAPRHQKLNWRANFNLKKSG